MIEIPATRRLPREFTTWPTGVAGTAEITAEEPPDVVAAARVTCTGQGDRTRRWRDTPTVSGLCGRQLDLAECDPPTVQRARELAAEQGWAYDPVGRKDLCPSHVDQVHRSPVEKGQDDDARRS